MEERSVMGRLSCSGLMALAVFSVPMILGCGGMLSVLLPMYEGECGMMGPPEPCTLSQWMSRDVLANSFFWVLLGIPSLAVLIVSGIMALLSGAITWLLLGRRRDAR